MYILIKTPKHGSYHSDTIADAERGTVSKLIESAAGGKATYLSFQYTDADGETDTIYIPRKVLKKSIIRIVG
jgi:hypothetical protein